MNKASNRNFNHLYRIGYAILVLMVLWMGVLGVPSFAQSTTQNTDNTAVATASQDDELAEELIVLSQLSKNQPQQTQDTKTIQHTPQSSTVSGGFIAADTISLNRPVVDMAQALSSDEIAQLEQRLRTLHESGKAQAAVVIVPTTGDVPIFDYAVSIAKRWQLGSAKDDEGLLMVIAINDRKIYTLTGYGLEGVLPDAILKRITREYIRPAFQKGNYAQGINAGFDQIIGRLNSDPETLARADQIQEEQDTTEDEEVPIIALLVFGVVVGNIMNSLFGRVAGATINSIFFAVMGWLFGLGLVGTLIIAVILWFVVLLGLVPRGFGGGFSSGDFGGGSDSSGGGFGSGGGYSGGGGGFGGGGAGDSW